MNFISNNYCIQLNINGESYNCNSYYPNSNENLDDYGLMFLYSPYYVAELDFKKVLYSSKRTILGWLIPLALLEETDLDIINELNHYLKLYADIAIKKMIKWYFENNDYQDIDENFKLSDLFNPGVQVLIYRTSVVKTTDIKKILPSLYNEGIYYVEDPTTVEMPSYISTVMEEIVSERKQNNTDKQITLYPIEFIKINPFVESLYKKILPKEKDVIHRFISLYQIIEILMELLVENEIYQIVCDYCNNRLSKNDFSEQISTYNKEIAKIDKIMQNITLDKYMAEFISTTKVLFGMINYVNANENNYAKIMYALRNTLVHNMRLIIEHKAIFDNIVQLYEKNIFYILKNTTLTLKPKFLPLVIDRDKSRKSNIKLLKKYMSDIVYK